jgi:hypothetical protein
MAELTDNLISEIGKIGYDVEGWTPKNHLSSVKSIDIGIPEAKFHIYIGITSENKLEIEIKPLHVFDSYNGLESVREIQIIEEEDVNNIGYIIKLINRMERSVFAKMLNQVNAIQSKLNYIFNYR